MSDSNWRKFLKDRGGLIASLFAAAILMVVTIQLARGWQWEIEYDAARHAANYAADAKNDISAKCIGLTAQARDDCEDQINDPARTNQREEYDLAAQKVVALWTAVMGGMAVVGVCLSAVGVYLIWQTWDATREAAAAAHATNQAYVAIEGGKILVIALGGDLLSSQLKKIPVNLGAINVGRARCVVDNVRYSISSTTDFPNDFDSVYPSPAKSVKADETIRVLDVGIPPERVPVFVKGVVEFRDALNSNRKAHFVFHVDVVRPKNPDEGFSRLKVEIARPDGWPADT